MKSVWLVACGLLASTFVGAEVSARDTAGPAPAPAGAAAAPPAAPARPPPPALAPPADLKAAAVAPTPGDARDGAHPDRTEEAKRAYERGAEAFAAGQNAQAIRYFRRAAELAPNAKLTYNIALAYAEMGDSGRALLEYRRYLKQEKDPALVDDVTARVQKLERELSEAGVQLLSVSSRPAGAVVQLDAQPVGVTPWSGEVTPGAHRLSLTLEGHAAHEGTVWLTAERAAELDVELSPAPPRQPEPPPSRRSVSSLTWSFLGVGVGAIAGGIAFEVSRATSSERAGNTSSIERAAEERGAADAKQMASLLLLGSGTAFLVGGGVLLALDLMPAKEKNPSPTSSLTEARVELPCGPDFCGLMTRGSF